MRAAVECFCNIEMPHAGKSCSRLVTRSCRTLKSTRSSAGVARDGRREGDVGQSKRGANVESVLPGLALIDRCGDDCLRAGARSAGDQKISAAGFIYGNRGILKVRIGSSIWN